MLWLYCQEEGISISHHHFPRKMVSALDHGPKNWLTTEGGQNWELHLVTTDAAWRTERHLNQGIAIRRVNFARGHHCLGTLHCSESLSDGAQWSPHGLTYEIWKLKCFPHGAVTNTKWGNVRFSLHCRPTINVSSLATLLLPSVQSLDKYSECGKRGVAFHNVRFNLKRKVCVCRVLSPWITKQSLKSINLFIHLWAPARGLFWIIKKLSGSQIKGGQVFRIKNALPPPLTFWGWCQVFSLSQYVPILKQRTRSGERTEVIRGIQEKWGWIEKWRVNSGTEKMEENPIFNQL